VHNGGTYVNMDGPQFSTRAESETNRRLGFDVIGMTNLPEAKLAREAEIALATMAMITDYDCWKTDEEPVTSEAVIAHLHANAESAKRVLVETIAKIPANPSWPEHVALDSALVTARDLWPMATKEKLRPILERFSKRPSMLRRTAALLIPLALAAQDDVPKVVAVSATPAPTHADKAALASDAAAPAGPKITYSQCHVEGPYIAMTFDDGPHGTQTPRLLEMLKARGLKATFFVCGQCVAEYPEIAKRIVEEGHEIANHSWSHPNLIPMSESAVRDQLERTHTVVKQATGVDMKTFRPPYGNFTLRQRTGPTPPTATRSSSGTWTPRLAAPQPRQDRGQRPARDARRLHRPPARHPQDHHRRHARHARWPRRQGLQIRHRLRAHRHGQTGPAQTQGHPGPQGHARAEAQAAKAS
jgi:peptidoglycan/xylan/chitin deacetylase (PgdA/CDA1 family)